MQFLNIYQISFVVVLLIQNAAPAAFSNKRWNFGCLDRISKHPIAGCVASIASSTDVSRKYLLLLRMYSIKLNTSITVCYFSSTLQRYPLLGIRISVLMTAESQRLIRHITDQRAAPIYLWVSKLPKFYDLPQH
ncbi:hypothetical protein PSHT_04032 [Puccinia striiformis]|uniref:Secreted protein n=1 Tax=Puccinia striiformis TaxID=27350 RepID=A0A2S4WDQ4_9BASI|nr:hypothetical protein PSHT_04032 [Puccinia striiformis]